MADCGKTKCLEKLLGLLSICDFVTLGEKHLQSLNEISSWIVKVMTNWILFFFFFLSFFNVYLNLK